MTALKTAKYNMGAKLGQKLPHRWKTGPCERTHNQYEVYAQQLNQAKWRKEEWDLSFEDWLALWEPRWDTGRGRTRDCYCLVRKDYGLPWNKHNIELITRQEHVETQQRKLDQLHGCSTWRQYRKRTKVKN